ncbi:hypothetical protein [Paenibacillus massiliensis]|uniref:hypothetical protein n=1 Tax=Paenibacillus massiliensis TaxID=225917 RepID=UPI0004920B05|nr:hypothetical protein [Paenibacillus massiliensis]
MKWISWMVRKTLSIVMIVALTLLTTGYVVNAYVQSLLGMFNIKLEGTSVLGLNIGQGLFGSKQPSAGEGGVGTNGTSNSTSNSTSNGLNGTVGGTQGERKPTDSSREGLPNGSAASSSTSNSPAHGQESEGGTPGSVTGNPASEEEESTPEGALPVMGTADDEDTPTAASPESATPPVVEGRSLEEEELVMTPGDLVDRKDELNTQQKQEILSMLMNKLPAEDMQMISTAMEGGLTEKELQDIQQVIAKRLTNEEYTKLMDMLKVSR